MLKECLNCYYHSYIGLQNYCCHPGHAKRIKKPHAKCGDYFAYDRKGFAGQRKFTAEKMQEIKNRKADETYRITHAGTAIECYRCGMISFHPGDVTQHYCGRCKIFHDDN